MSHDVYKLNKCQDHLELHEVAKISVSHMAFYNGIGHIILLGGTTIQGHIFWLHEADKKEFSLFFF